MENKGLTAAEKMNAIYAVFDWDITDDAALSIIMAIANIPDWRCEK